MNKLHLYPKDVRFENSEALHEEYAPKPEANHGLRFTKFFGGWGEENGCPKQVEKAAINAWLRPKRGQSSLSIGNSDHLTNAHTRLKALSDAREGAHFKLNLISRLLIGIGLPHPVENGFLFHPTLDVPYIPGTALKQVAQDWAEEEEGLGTDDPDRLRLFGGEAHGLGSVAFLDALPCAPACLTGEQITNHYPGYYQNVDPFKAENKRDDMHQPADWYEPIPVTLLAVDASFDSPLRFCFTILPLRGAQEGDVAKAQEWLTKGLEIYGVGARTTLGFGRLMSEEAIETQKEATAQKEKERKERHEAQLAEQEKERKRAQEEAHRNWQPAIGDEVIYDSAEPGERFFVTKLSSGEDFFIALEDGSGEMCSDKKECKPLPPKG